MAIKSYKVIFEDSIEKFQKEVEAHLRKGWIICGSMSCQSILCYSYKDRDGEIQFVTNEMYYQPMTHEVL